MELLEEDALRRQLAAFPRSDEVHAHRSQMLVYTAGVKFLADRCGLSWLIDLIAAWQWRALADRDLRFFQLWELGFCGTRRVLTCSKHWESVAFGLPAPNRETDLGSVSLYVEFGVLMLPSEHARRQDKTRLRSR
jgi:hypothetical protein